MLNNHDSISDVTAGKIMNVTPKIVAPQTYAVEALRIMQENNITQLIVSEDNKPVGFIHLHDLLREGIV